MIISGQFVKTEHRKGEFTPDDAAPGTPPIAYDFHLVHVFDGESIIEVRLPEGMAAADLPYKLRDNVEFSVDVPRNVKFRVNEAALMHSLNSPQGLHAAV